MKLTPSHASITIPILFKCALAGRGNPFEMLEVAQRAYAPDAAIKILQKAAQGAGSLGDVGFMGNLADAGIASVAFVTITRCMLSEARAPQFMRATDRHRHEERN